MSELIARPFALHLKYDNESKDETNLCLSCRANVS